MTAEKNQETEMIDTRTAPYAALLLRVSLGILFLRARRNSSAASGYRLNSPISS
jgi:hypothetical protein